MRGLQRLGEYLWEFFVVTAIAAVSAVTVLPFFPVTVGLADYFGKDFETRAFKDIFSAIAKNAKIIAAYTLFQLVAIIFPALNIFFFNTHPEASNAIIFPALNIFFFNTHPEASNAIVLGISYAVLAIGCLFAITAPTVIANMNVTFFQLLKNCLILFSGGWANGILAAICVAGVAALVIFYPYVVVLTLYALPLTVTKLMRENFLRLKAKALGTSVYELKQREKRDDYLDEYGKIKRNPQNVRNGEDDNEEKHN